MIRLLLLGLACAGVPGCASQYRIELWNDTGHAVDVTIVERSAVASRADRHATIAPEGWLDYRIDHGQAWPRRMVRVQVRGVEAAGEADLTGRQLFQGRVILAGAGATIEPISARQARERASAKE